ncbi:DUF397 domain-containing protein [Actinoallomurus sp. NPDC052308]
MSTPQIVTNWRKTTRSENQGACVEVALAVTAVSNQR